MIKCLNYNIATSFLLSTSLITTFSAVKMISAGNDSVKGTILYGITPVSKKDEGNLSLEGLALLA